MPPPVQGPPRRQRAPADAAEAARQMIGEFRRAGGGEGAARLARAYSDGRWRGRLLELGALLLGEGLSPAGFVRFACGRCLRRDGRFPRPEAVFGAEWRERWLEDYRMHGVGENGDLPTYRATAARRALHLARYDADDLQAGARDGGSLHPEDGGGPVGAGSDPPTPQA